MGTKYFTSLNLVQISSGGIVDRAKDASFAADFADISSPGGQDTLDCTCVTVLSSAIHKRACLPQIRIKCG